MLRKLLIVVGIATILMTPAALAGHGAAPVTMHRTYELGPTFFVWSCPPGDAGLDCDPTGQTQDDSIDLGGVQIFAEDVPVGVDTVQASVVDDVWGAGVVAGFLCTEENGDNICGDTEAGEVQQNFCGQSEVMDIPPAPNWEKVDVFVSFPVWQVEHCDPTAAPTGATSGGVANPAAGIFITFG